MIVKGQNLSTLKNIDSSFIAVPSEKWALKTITECSQATIETDGFFKDNSFHSELSAKPKLKEGVFVSYKRLSAGFAVDLFGKEKDAVTFSVNSYGNRFSIESGYISENSFSGFSESGLGPSSVSSGSVRHRSLNLDVCYFLNFRQFSFPAVFNQSKLQKQSAGSWIVAASYKWSKTIANQAADESSIRGHSVGIGGGYGYNWVTGRWLIHFSLIPTLVVYDNSAFEANGEKEDVRCRLTNMIATGNYAVIYNKGKFLIGITITLHNCTLGNPDHIRTEYLRMRGNVVVGVRL
ncbi:MAG: DUF4421 family protein [Bacteroidales bacterium]